MRKFLLSFLFLLTIYTASSQKVYFIYLQTEAQQPFYVRMNEQLYSSTALGYLILPKLRDTIYNFNVGFPQNKWPEQSFSVAIMKKDHGYLLKNFNEKGWGLFNLQTLAVQMAAVNSKTSVVQPQSNEVSAFTEILSRAADDPSLREKPIHPILIEKKTVTLPQDVVKKEDSKTAVPEPAIVKNEEKKSSPAENTIVKTEEPKKEKLKVEDPNKDDAKKEESPAKNEEIKKAPEEIYKPTVITKRSESSTSEGFGLVFIDNSEDGTKDTIRIVIPNPKPVVEEIQEPPKEEKKFIEIIPDNAKKDTTLIPEQINETAFLPEKREPANKNNCREVANESDFLKLRKKMAAETDDDDMVDEARKYFKIKCFTTAQVKNIGALFLDDLGKYKLYDLAFHFVSDMENFPGLESELKNEYYINRFRAMLR